MMSRDVRYLVELAERLTATGEIGDGMVAQFHGAALAVRAAENDYNVSPFAGGVAASTGGDLTMIISGRAGADLSGRFVVVPRRPGLSQGWEGDIMSRWHYTYHTIWYEPEPPCSEPHPRYRGCRVALCPRCGIDRNRVAVLDGMVVDVPAFAGERYEEPDPTHDNCELPRGPRGVY